MRKLIVLSLLAFAVPAAASDGPTIAQKIAERTADDPRTGVITFKTSNEKGQVRSRSARLAVMETASAHRMVLSFEKPASIRETSFLTYDHKDPRATDETWLFLPATSRTRRIPSSDQSDQFMGTELTYGDVKDNFKFGVADYVFTYGGKNKSGQYILRGKAVSPAVAKRLGYGSFIAFVDPATYFPRVIRFNDLTGQKLKTVTVAQVQKIGASWMATDFTVTSHQTGRKTSVKVSGLKRSAALSGTLFDPKQLDRVASRMK